MNPLNLSKTHTTKFILPMAFDENIKYDKVLQDILDTYIAIYDQPEHDDKIIILKDGDGIENQTFDIHEVPDKWADDYVKILAGKYSELSEEYKQHLMNFWEVTPKDYLHSVLYKDKSALRNRELELKRGKNIYLLDELWPEPDMQSEIYGLGAL